MNFSYNWLQSFFSKKLPKPQKLAELLTMHSFEVEGLEKKSKDCLLDIDILPDRSSDCFSHSGIAGEIAAITGLKKNDLKTGAKEKRGSAKDFVNIKVENSNDCPRYSAKVITGVKVGPSPKWIKDRIVSCGVQPINNIVDIANYVMLETGQPLHAFDIEKIGKEKGTAKIVVRRARKGEKIMTLDNKEYKLDKSNLVIADPEGPLAIAGVKGGKKAEIAKKTDTIVLESANFNPLLIRRTSRGLQLRTDASWRFENETDPNLTKEAIERAAFLIQKEAKGEPISGIEDFYPRKKFPKKIRINPSDIRGLLGLVILEKEIMSIFSRLGLKNKKKGKLIEVEVPTRRMDLLIPEDLIEEVGRIYGYENIPSSFPLISLAPPEKNFSVSWENKVKDILKELGFFETYNYSFIGEKTKEVFNYKELAELENPLSKDYKYLRPSLIPNLLDNAKRNKKEVSIFELGKIFKPGKKTTEKKMLCALSATRDFYAMKGVVDLLLNRLGISDIWYDDFKPTPEQSNINVWEKGRRAEIKVGSEEIGFLGEISSDLPVKTAADLVAFEMNFEKLQKITSEEQEYQPISRFPAAVRDIAVLVPRGTKVETVMNKINSIGGSLIRDIDLFDIYEGENLPSGKKNLAFHIIYQAEDRTLSSKAISELQERIINGLDSETGWQVRR